MEGNMGKYIYKKKLAHLLLFLLVIAFVFFLQYSPVRASNASYRVDDQAGLLGENQRIILAGELDRISERYGTDIVILTLGEEISILNATDYADTYFENQNLGLGPSQSGMLFMISMAERDWAIATHGEAIDVFNDYAQEQLIAAILPALRDNNMYAAFSELASFSEETLDNAERGIFAEEKVSRPFSFYILPPAIALLLTALIMKGLKAPLTSVGFRSGANSYLLDNSMQIANSNDYFLSSSIARTVIPKSSETKSGGGRSTTHTSSSGRTFGGSSGKF
jgi:uncharacterized protein